MSAFYSSPFLRPAAAAPRLDTDLNVNSARTQVRDLDVPRDTPTDFDTESFFSISPLTRHPTPVADRLDDLEDWPVRSSSESDISSSASDEPPNATSGEREETNLQLDAAPSIHASSSVHLELSQEPTHHTESDPMIYPGVYKIVNFKSGTVLGLLPGEHTRISCSSEGDNVDIDKWLVTSLGSGALIRAFSNHHIASDYLGPANPSQKKGIREGTVLGLTAYPLVWTVSPTLFPPPDQQGGLAGEGVVAAVGWPHGDLVLDLDDFGKAERGTGVSFHPQRSYFEPCQYWRFIRCDEKPQSPPAQISWPVRARTDQARKVVSWARNVPPHGQAAVEPPRTLRRKVAEEEVTEDSWEEGTGVVRKVVKTTTTVVTETSTVTL
ncbi:hypothetical protein BDV98DRAFT_573406 [Pterulicium gracile]|uniref:Ricin B lectin domain-containing protein n=1 Tax=Pterulicium gracile TaxID=1884261 RepID=A0A5C3QA45_9AGAR|nr:hypothetical protein BDV98DRAFT_573406 [Pterula gracilis]